MRRLFRGNDEERKDKEQVRKMKIACDDVQGILTVIMSCVSRNRLETIKRMMTRSEKMFCTFSNSNGHAIFI